ncbi:family 20 glycosylhydrolase [Bacteroides fragilis]|uniref:family 20 glycosylhydrolase n=1 Tax=Bacteroides fragilis TaxID=817 RepID=UPI001C6FD49D|nr:family 20 glycosylhydrolase [Bacteroides fragilis]MBW9278169.1 hypothetical protein [Bacteroides fragilis]
MKIKLNTIALSVFAIIALDAGAQMIIPAPKEIRTLKENRVKIEAIDARVSSGMNLPSEGYTLKIKGEKAIIRAKDERGLVWAKSTLSQLKDKDGMIPIVSITDYPSFPMRAFMYDTGRNFIPVEMIKNWLNLMSFYKINAFHWHLTDYPAWRIECKVYPQLNDPHYQRKGRDEGKFYTYDEIRDVISYAKERGIMIIPEIDMPGHSQYFIDTFGFGMASVEGMKVLEKCLIELFTEINADDCPYIHIGSDEVSVDNPKEFMAFCENMAREHGRIPMAWSPGLPTAPETIRQIWFTSVGEEIATNGYKFPYLDSYMGYMNHIHPVLNTMKFYFHQPCSLEKTNGYALGGNLALFPDVRIGDKNLISTYNGLANGLAAYSESFWCGGKRLPLAEENLVPAPGTEWYEKLSDFERRLTFHRDNFLYDWDMRWVANASIPWQVTLPQARGTASDDMKWTKAWGGVIDMQAICKKNGVELLPTMDAWMTTEIYAERDTVITAWVGFDAPDRADRMSDGIGYQGYWEAQGRVFAGNQEIFPAKSWNEPGKHRYHDHTWHNRGPEETPYTDEQLCWIREPARIPLKNGWNQIKVYCPRVFPNKNNWMITFIPVTVDGKGHISESKGIKFR